MASQSKVVHGKNNSPSGFLLRQRHVPVLQVRSLPDSDLLLDSSSDDGDDDDDNFFLLRLAHNFSFGVDFTSFATQNNGTSLLPFSLIVFTCHGQL
jgi:hypothetical protein